MGRKDGKRVVEPHWAPLPREPLGRLQIASVLARHLVPLACLWWFDGSVLQFLLLCVFNLAFTIASIGTVSVAVSTRQESAPISTADAVAGWITLAVVCAGISLMLSFLFGGVIAVFAAHEAEGLWNSTLWWSLLALVASAVPGMVMQYQQDLKSRLGDEERKRRDQPTVGVLLFSAVFISMLSAWTLNWGRAGAILMALAVTAMFVFRDLRPDLARELTRPGNRPP